MAEKKSKVAKTTITKPKKEPEAIVAQNVETLFPANKIIDILNIPSFDYFIIAKQYGFDDIPLVGLMSPGITTLQKPKSEIGAIAAERILEMLDGKTVPERTLLDSLLIERESVKGEKL